MLFSLLLSLLFTVTMVTVTVNMATVKSRVTEKLLLPCVYILVSTLKEKTTDSFY